MKLLKDDELKDIYRTCILGVKPPEKWDTANSPVQPSSIDLHIGSIFRPAQRTSKSATVATKELVLDPGATAMIRTAETLSMPGNIAAIGFPPSHVSVEGLLITNPGHVDPGYKGPMHLTVINMSRSGFTLRPMDPIVTLLFFQLDDKVSADYAMRNPEVKADSTNETVNKLSPSSGLFFQPAVPTIPPGKCGTIYLPAATSPASTGVRSLAKRS
jgi:deoxycytidine triphosphate deaminase